MHPDRIRDLLLPLVWRDDRLRGALRAADGEPVSVADPGRWDEAAACLVGVDFTLGGTRCRGRIAFPFTPGADRDEWAARLGAVPAACGLHADGRSVPGLVLPVPDGAITAARKLFEGASDRCCGERIAALDGLYRNELFTRLTLERLGRKCDDVEVFRRECHGDWNQTLYLLVLRTMGGPVNRLPYTELARRVPYAALARERDRREYVEAMLLGTAGLLDPASADADIQRLCTHYAYLQRKHDLRPLWPGEWNLSGIRPVNHPFVRLLQVAALISTSDFLFDRLVRCCSAAELRRLFGAEVSDRWQGCPVPGVPHAVCPARLGEEKAILLGINVVSVLQLAYGRATDDERLRERAVALLESLPPERNRLLDRWRAQGLVPRSAFDTQALLQLGGAWCDAGRCATCPIGKNVIKKAFAAPI